MSSTRKAFRELERKSIAVLTAAGYVCSHVGIDSFNIIGIGRSDIVLVQTAANEWPDAKQLRGMKALTVPRNAKKLVHLWKNYARIPEVKEV